MLAWLVDDKDIEPHVPVWDKAQRTDGTLSSSDFVWNEPADVLLRPCMDDFAMMYFHRAWEAIDAGSACVEAAAAQLQSVVARPHQAAPRTPAGRTGP